MKSKKETNKKKTIAYEYLFVYLGGDKFQDKIITGASVNLAIRVYKAGEEIKFTEETSYHGKDLSDVFRVSYDRHHQFTVTKNLLVDNLFRLKYEWDKIEAEVVDYILDYADTLPEEIRERLPEPLKSLPCSSPMEVSEKEFRDFIKAHIDDFDISDNINAQVTSVSFID